jgi:hypothetical protein
MRMSMDSPTVLACGARYREGTVAASLTQFGAAARLATQVNANPNRR